MTTVLIKRCWIIVASRDVAYYSCNEVSILPLIERLSFIQDKRHWGAPFRFGILEISQGLRVNQEPDTC